MNEFFENAKSIWIKERALEMNLRVQFKTILTKTEENTTIKIATSGIYQLWINGKFVSYGPARAGKGHFRVENLCITKFLNNKKNIVVIEVCGYNCTSFYIQEWPSFVVAEIFMNGKSVAWTGEHFSARVNPFYIQKIQRYTIQRPMIESYRIQKLDTYFNDLILGTEPVEIVDGGKFIERCAPYPLFELIEANKIANAGIIKYSQKEELLRQGSLLEISEFLHGFKLEELELVLTDEYQYMDFETKEISFYNLIVKDTYQLYKFSHNITGMLTLDITCDDMTTLYISFDEILTNGLVNPFRLRSASIFKLELCKGRHHIQMFEVYTMQYIQVCCTNGSVKINNIGMVEYKHPPILKQISTDDEEIKKIWQAAIETWRQNSVDLFMDCPSRERAGWLCDSYFIAKTEYCLTGKNIIEKSFLENFLHEENYLGLPNGMLPMCYPADHLGGLYIPQWAMWLVLELEDYLERSGDRELIDSFKEKVFKLLNYFEGFENSDGLLEKLPGWNFVEWSEANNFVLDINYPTNMLYVAMLSAVAKLYGKYELNQKAKKVKSVILKQSFDGEFFVDNAIRTKDGKLFVTNNKTEACQYYAFFFGIANKETHSKLLNVLANSFGINRDFEKTYTEVFQANSFIGNYLRFDILLKYGYNQEVLNNIKEFFGYMADRTGTLWEHTQPRASCNHGFASYVSCWLEKLFNISEGE